MPGVGEVGKRGRAALQAVATGVRRASSLGASSLGRKYPLHCVQGVLVRPCLPRTDSDQDLSFATIRAKESHQLPVHAQASVQELSALVWRNASSTPIREKLRYMIADFHAGPPTFVWTDPRGCSHSPNGLWGSVHAFRLLAGERSELSAAALGSLGHPKGWTR